MRVDPNTPPHIIAAVLGYCDGALNNPLKPPKQNRAAYIEGAQDGREARRRLQAHHRAIDGAGPQ